MPLLSRRVVLAGCLCRVVLLPALAIGQTVSGGLSGTVVDQTHQVIQGATVTLVNEQTAETRLTRSNETGAFVFSAVRPGTYTVRVELSGFTPFERRNTVVPARLRPVTSRRMRSSFTALPNSGPRCRVGLMKRVASLRAKGISATSAPER